MNKEEFIYCWNNWIKKVCSIFSRCFSPKPETLSRNFKIVRPISALIIVDVQNDFISGTLAISNCPAGQNGEEVRNCLHHQRCVKLDVSSDLNINHVNCVNCLASSYSKLYPRGSFQRHQSLSFCKVCLQ